jgi:transposase
VRRILKEPCISRDTGPFDVRKWCFILLSKQVVDKSAKVVYNRDEVIKMPKTYRINAEQVAEIKEARSLNKSKEVDRRLRAVQLRGEGMSNEEIATIVEVTSDAVSRWVASYVKYGINTLLEKERIGYHRNMSYEEEKALLEPFVERANAGQIVEVSEIKHAYMEAVGHSIGAGQIYRVLKRQGWRKVKPRSRHPKKATPEVMEASKKLTIGCSN